MFHNKESAYIFWHYCWFGTCDICSLANGASDSLNIHMRHPYSSLCSKINTENNNRQFEDCPPTERPLSVDISVINVASWALFLTGNHQSTWLNDDW